MDNMYNQTDWFRPTCYPQCIDQNFKYNREYEWANYGVDFVPSVSPSFNQWIDGDGTQLYLRMKICSVRCVMLPR